MDPMTNDPLIAYLKKTAESTELDRNLTDMPLGEEEHALTRECPMPTCQMTSKGRHQLKDSLGDMFEHSDSVRSKNTEKDFEYDPGVVDRILGI